MRAEKNRYMRRFLDYWQYDAGDSHLPDAYSPHRRRFLAPYQRRLSYVRDYWLYYLTALFIFGVSMPLIASTMLFSTFMSIAFLEETPYPDPPYY